ncbi:MAG: hypothetical protein WBE18_04505, partial [Gammaproteobacteria bacterium]
RHRPRGPFFRMPCKCRFQTKLHPAVGEYIPVFYGLPTTPTRHSYPTTLFIRNMQQRHFHYGRQKPTQQEASASLRWPTST